MRSKIGQNILPVTGTNANLRTTFCIWQREHFFTWLVVKIEGFIKKRKYLRNLSAKTLIWYRCSFEAFKDGQTRDDFTNRIAELRERGVSAIAANTYLPCINALNRKGAGLKLPKLKKKVNSSAP